MNDRELLKLAAKAAGLKIDNSEYNGGGANNDGFDILGRAVLDWHNGVTWDPLNDDGDALRLAVKIGETNLDDLLFEYYLERQADVEIDPCAAHRRAIVLAASNIGKRM